MRVSEAAFKLKPDLVVMDIGLPRLDGIAATQRIKAELPDIRVVVLTSHTTETEIIAALASGADAYSSRVQCGSLQRSLQLEKVRPTWTLRFPQSD